jgi:RNA polymerase sigma factor (sigma-70 family)
LLPHAWGPFFDAKDATHEAMIRAWKGMDRFDGRASLKNWLYRIATNVCLHEIHNEGGGRAQWRKDQHFPAHLL